MDLSYETLRLIWWVLLGVLLGGFAIMDGFDLGVAMLLPFVAKTDSERRITLNSIGATWEGNQVWFILGGGAIFAAWPPLYAVSFSGFYLAMFAILLALIIRPVGFKYRSKLECPKWRATWDLLLTIGGFVPSLIFGVAIGNVLQGVPFHFDLSLRAFYTGTFWQLLNPFALLCGITSVLMLLTHGALYLTTKTELAIRDRAHKIARVTALLLVTCFVLGGVWLTQAVMSYSVTSVIDPNGPSNPLYKTVTMQHGGWLSNFWHYPWMITAPILGLFAPLLAALTNSKNCNGKLSFIFSSLGITGIIATVGFSLFPFLLPSSTNPEASLLIWDASSSSLTLLIMLIATVIFMPIILAYTAWVYHVLRGRITEAHVESNSNELY